nr:MAG TPA: hypothetical protein [Caudoviricetes sp.]
MRLCACGCVFFCATTRAGGFGRVLTELFHHCSILPT